MTPNQKALDYAIKTNCSDLIGQKIIAAYVAGHIAGAEALSAIPDQGWISVEKELPEDGQYVLAYSEVAGFNPTKNAITEYSKKYGFVSMSGVTAWMPLPNPPSK